MKKTIFSVALAAVLAAGCSSDDPVINGGNKGGGVGDGYISLSIKAPTSSAPASSSMRGASRAETNNNDNFKQGTAAEYKIHDVTVLIFDDSNNLERIYSTENNTLPAVDSWTSLTGDNQNVETTAKTDAMKVTTGDKHVIVVMNNNGKFNFSGIRTLSDYQNMSFSINNSREDLASNKYNKIDRFTMDGTTDGCFFMTTAPIVKGSTIERYATVTAQNTIEKAKATPAKVYVERAVGKVEAGIKPNAAGWTNGTYTVPTGSGNAGAKITILKWTLNITNNAAYVSRQVDDKWLNTTTYPVEQFVGGVEPKRIYWAQDPNYKTTSTSQLYSFTPGNESANVTTDLDASEYCLENTFDIAHQTQDQTTRVVFKAKYVPAGFTDGEDWYTIGSTTTPLHASQAETLINSKIREINHNEGSSIPNINMNDLYATVDNKLTTNSFQSSITQEQVNKVNEAIGSIKVYKGGICYYWARVRHFNDFSESWNGTNHTSYTESYDLGRYGIVRNNWYRVNINTVKNPGEPTIDVPTNRIDDENNYYIDCDINILSWAYRSQDIDL